jgi:predicted nucleotidyltransferase
LVMHMKKREKILKILNDEMPLLKSRYLVKRCGLFGSYVHDEATRRSDVDLLVQFKHPVGFFKFIELEDYLSKKIGIKVDLVTEDALKPLIRPYVMEQVVYA